MSAPGSGIELQSGLAQQSARALTKARNAQREAKTEAERGDAADKPKVASDRATSAFTWVANSKKTTGDTVSLSQPDFEIETPELNLAALLSQAAGFVIETVTRRPSIEKANAAGVAQLEQLEASQHAKLEKFGEAVKARNNANKNIPFLESLSHDVGTALAALDAAGVPSGARAAYRAKLYVEGRTTNQNAVRDTLMIEQKSLLT